MNDLMNKSQVCVKYRVPYADTDQMGVVYYANYLVYFERARNELLRELGLSYREMEKRGFALPVLQAHVDYRRPAQYDDQIDISGWLESIRAIRLQINCTVYRNDTLIAKGYTIHAFVARETLRPMRIPDDIAACFHNAGAL